MAEAVFPLPGLRIPSAFSDRRFLLFLALKLIASALFASDYLTTLFIPFLQFFASNPLQNPYQHFFDIGMPKVFPYPPAMLLAMGVPFLLFGFLSGPGIGMASIFLARVPLLAADLLTYYLLCRIFEDRKSQVITFYWASPVIFYINYVHGQLDAIPIALLIASVYLLFCKRVELSFLVLAMGLASKSHLFIVLPLYFLYLLKKGMPLPRIAGLFGALLLVYAIILSPYAFSEGFAHLVFGASEQLRVFSLSIPFSPPMVFYVVPAAYFYLIFKMASFNKITRDIFFMAIGLMFAMLVTLITPAQGWYLWCVPFIAYFFIKKDHRLQAIYHVFGIAYAAFFLMSPSSDVFSVLQVSLPQLASLPPPYYMLKSMGIDAGLLAGVLFTTLTSTLAYISYLIYKDGIRSSLLFQRKNGTPSIGIAGDSGSGKTTLAQGLALLLGQASTNIVYGDDAHKWERGHQNWGKYTHLNPTGNYINQNYSQLKDLKNGKPIMRRIYDHSTGKFSAPVKFSPKDFLVAEGLHTLFIPEESSLFELKVFLDPDASLRKLWKIRRDTASRSYEPHEVIEQMKKREPDSEKFIRQQRQNADIVVSHRMSQGGARFLQVLSKTSFQSDALSEALSSCCPGLSVEFEYIDMRMQAITLKGTASPQELSSALRKAGVDLDEYVASPGFFAPDLDGALQACIIFFLNQRLGEISGSG